MKTVHLAVVAVGATALIVLGGAGSAEAEYLNVVVDIVEYDVTEYTDFNLVRMNMSLENLGPDVMLADGQGTRNDLMLFLGGDITVAYEDRSYADVRARGGDISVNDCTSSGRFEGLNVGHTVYITACFMIGKSFEPDGLKIISQHSNFYGDLSAQVIPFHSESTYCFVQNSDRCNANNIQRVDGTPEPPPPPPEPEPQEPEPPATLLYTIYHNQTGVLTLVFNQLVVVSNPDRIHFIHDINAFIEDGTAPNLGDAELHTVDGKRQSAMLAFTLSDTLQLEVIQSLRNSADLAMFIETRAIYAAEGFVDITAPDNSQILVPDITIIR